MPSAGHSQASERRRARVRGEGFVSDTRYGPAMSLPIQPISLTPSTAAADAVRRRPRNVSRALGVLLRNPLALVGIFILAVVALAGIFASVLFPGDPLAIVGQPFVWPGTSGAHPLGTDSLGRDVLSGIVHGAGVSLLVGLSATALGLMAGVGIGAAAGYFGGWTDAVLSRLIEIFQTVPNFVMLIVLVAIAEPSITTVSVAIAVVTWPTVARLTRAEFRSIREKEFVMAARSLGYGHFRIIVSEILPSALPPIIVTASVMVASAILTESALSFMGLGDPNVVSWGSMIGSGREFLRTAWYLSALPGVAIMLTVLALNLIGDALNEALNPRTGQDQR
ncbi:MAG: dipeptide/oligopeptide transporter permease protein [Sphingomonadales bacterium]|nr:dipeptide/oligopeptide transporter permease protein [Sphingomonadales bacterium]